MRALDNTPITDLEKSLKSATGKLFDAGYQIAKQTIVSTRDAIVEHPFLTAGAVGAAIALAYFSRGRSVSNLARELPALGRTGEVIGAGARLAEPGAAAIRSAHTARTATGMVEVPIVKGPWKEWTVGNVQLQADHWVAAGYTRGRNSVVEVMLNGQRQGTGFFVDANGLAVTNHHVVKVPNLAYEVALGDGSRYAARVVSLDAQADLAVLRILGANNRKFSALELGSSTSKSAEQVLALGFPERVKAVSVSPGSLINHETVKTAATTHRRLEFDMIMKAGNSGSPVLGTDGKVVSVLNKYTFGETAGGPAVEHLHALLQATRSREIGSKVLVVNTTIGDTRMSLVDRLFRTAGSTTIRTQSAVAEPFTVRVGKAVLTSRPPLSA